MITFGELAKPRKDPSVATVASGLPVEVPVSPWPPEFPTVWEYGSSSCDRTENIAVGHSPPSPVRYPARRPSTVLWKDVIDVHDVNLRRLYSERFSVLFVTVSQNPQAVRENKNSSVPAPPLSLAILSPPRASWFLLCAIFVPHLDKTEDQWFSLGGEGFPPGYPLCEIAVLISLFHTGFFRPPAAAPHCWYSKAGQVPLPSHDAHLGHIASKLSFSSEGQSWVFARHHVKNTLSACHFNHSLLDPFQSCYVICKCQRTEWHTLWCQFTMIWYKDGIVTFCFWYSHPDVLRDFDGGWGQRSGFMASKSGFRLR